MERQQEAMADNSLYGHTELKKSKRSALPPYYTQNFFRSNIRPKNFGRASRHDAVGRYALHHDTSSAHNNVVADGNIANHTTIAHQEHIVTYEGIFSGNTSNGHVLPNVDLTLNMRIFGHHNSYAMMKMHLGISSQCGRDITAKYETYSCFYPFDERLHQVISRSTLSSP
jgi:hypothetical protein